jgi:hypothetical protein
MAASRLLVPALVALACGACSFADRQDFDRYLKAAPIQMSQGEAPDDAKPVGMIFAERSGFYLFGYVPVVTCTLQDTLDILVDQARAMKADGVSDLRLEYISPAFMALAEGPLLIKFPWFPDIKIHGMAWKRAPAGGNK